MVLRSDTILVLNDTILEKSADKASARDIIGRLSGGWHEVHTVVYLYKVTTFITTRSEKVFLYVDTTRVKFDTLDERDIKAYVETNELIDKAGSYGIQGIGGQMVIRIEEVSFTVVGLQMQHLGRDFVKVLGDDV